MRKMGDPASPPIDSLDGLAWTLFQELKVLSALGLGIEGDMHCSKCGGSRRMDVQVSYTPVTWDYVNEALNVAAWAPGNGLDLSNPRAVGEVMGEHLAPSLFRYRCLQCSTTFAAVIYMGATGPDLAVLGTHPGGLTTPHTPPVVAYYLDQAQRARSVGANSAAVAMYRAALEALMFEQGFTPRMLGPKLAELKLRMKNGTAPKWADGLDTEFMDLIGRLGNASIHVDDPDPSKQSAIDQELLVTVNELIQLLLFTVYDAPIMGQNRMNLLRAKLTAMKTK